MVTRSEVVSTLRRRPERWRRRRDGAGLAGPFATKADLYRVILLQTAVILGSTFAMLRLLLS